MKILEPIFIEVIEKLLHYEVEFILIGGYAVNYHGYGRYTGDIDFWLRPDAQNKDKFLKVFAELCINDKYVEEIRAMDFTIQQVISIGDPPIRIDFLTKVNLVDFDEAWPKRRTMKVKDSVLPIVDYHSLVLMKMNTDRIKDKLDIEELQKINNYSKDKSILDTIKNLFTKNNNT